MHRFLLASLLSFVACTTDDAGAIDADGDGYTADVDCDDSVPTVFPGATELCDGLDNDCDQRLDLDAADEITFYADADADGHGDAGLIQTGCIAPAGTVATGDDCDDTDAQLFPGNPERCDQRDNDCDAIVDEDPADATTWYADGDEDGYGDSSQPISACDAPALHVANDTDCDDQNATVHPEAPETDCDDPSDYNCDGSVAFADADGDGTPACGDCDDTDPSRNPSAVEVCDDAGTDEDCDFAADDDDDGTDHRTMSTWWADSDGDGYGDDAATTQRRCDASADTSGVSGDCDDTRAEVSPAGTEVCDTLDLDEDCDTLVDDADPSVNLASLATWYADLDGDGYGDVTNASSACDTPPGTLADASDCDDANANINPTATEVCDTSDTDEDCDTLIDDDDPSVTATTIFYADLDGDSFGDSANATDACAVPDGYVENTLDCDDGDSTINPAATENCSTTTDDDCDGDDNDDGAAGCTTYYYDADADGFGLATSLCVCRSTGAYTATLDTDCDDASAADYPGATESCGNGDDDNCDGSIDEACPSSYSGDYGADVASTSATDATAVIYGEALYDYFGEHLAVGDFDADGADDLSAGADGNVYAGAYIGSVFIYSGMPSGSVDAATSDTARIYGAGTTNTFSDGQWVLPDIDGDGSDELAVRRAVGTSDYLYLYEGEDLSGALAYNASATTYDDFTLTGPVSSLGDENATAGSHEVGIAHWEGSSSAGAVYVYTWGATGLASIATIRGETALDYAGRGLGGGPGNDTNGDGYDEVFVGAYGQDSGGGNAGAAYVVEAPVASTTYLSAADVKINGDSGDNLGALVHAPGDVDSDGYADLIAMAPYDDGGGSDAGAVFLFHDVDTDGISKDEDDGDAEAAFLGAAASDLVGSQPIATGDVDGDGSLDLLIGVPDADVSATGSGAAWLIYGPLFGTYDLSSSTDYDARFLGDSTSDGCGSAVALGDLDANGLEEIVVSCVNGDVGADANVGAVYVFSGA